MKTGEAVERGGKERRTGEARWGGEDGAERRRQGGKWACGLWSERVGGREMQKGRDIRLFAGGGGGQTGGCGEATGARRGKHRWRRRRGGQKQRDTNHGKGGRGSVYTPLNSC